MNSNEPINRNDQVLNEYTREVEPTVVNPEESSEDVGIGTIAAGVAGAAIGSVIGGKIAGKTGAIMGAVAGAVAGGLTAKATPDDAGEKLKNVTENAAEKVKDAAEQVKPAIEGTADKVKNAALNAADKVEDAAERAKPSNNQDVQTNNVKERLVIEPNPNVVSETPVSYGRENFPEAEVARVDDNEEIPENEKPSFVRKIDQLYQE